MTADRRRVEELFDRVLDVPRAQRDAWLRKECGADEAVRAEVIALLDAHERSGGILDAFVGGLAAVAGAPASALGGSSAGDTFVEPPDEVGPFRILREIGRGGMGVVYQARDTRLDRYVALKFLTSEASGDEAARRRFFAEARAASALDHRNLCTVHDVGTTPDGRLYLAMAFYGTETLDDRLRSGPLPMDEALDVATQTAEGLRCAHDAGIVHCDVKPSNLIRSAVGEVKILDFGVARLGDPRGDGRALGGTISYMSPEQARGESVDARTDLWSLGIVLYEMLTGRRPFLGTTPQEVRTAILEQEPGRPSTSADVPDALDDLVRRLLVKDPAGRIASAADLLSGLATLRAPSAVPSPGTADAVTPAPPLPAPIDSFVGRERERDELATLLSGARLVTLTGPAGTGKTRLAQETARGLGDRFPDGIWLITLAPLHDPALVPSALTSALDVTPNGGEPLLDALRRRIGSREILLVLDNFERVVAAAPLVSELLGTCPGLKVLTTSRVPLRLSGEHEYPVAPLPTLSADASSEERRANAGVRLFAERARAVRPTFHLDDDNEADVARLCERLDGLPLAIELAAARSRIFSPAELLERVGSRLELLKAPDRDRPARHQTLRQAIAWSHDLLEPDVQRVFRRTAVFHGASRETLQRALASTFPEDTLFDALEVLVDHSFLRTTTDPDGGTRFHLLETIRMFGVEELARTGEEASARDAHARESLELAERAAPELTGENPGVWDHRLRREHDNLRAALEHLLSADPPGSVRLAGSLYRFWLMHGELAEGRRWLERALGAVPEAEPDARTRALMGLSVLESNLGDNRAARRHLEEAARLAEAGSDDAQRNAILLHLGWVACEVSDLDVARDRSREGLELARQRGDTRSEALALHNLGWEALYRGDLPVAERRLRESLQRREAIGDVGGVAFTCTNLGWALTSRGKLDEAFAQLERARELGERAGGEPFVAWLLVHRTDAERRARGASAAIALTDREGRIWSRSTNPSILAFGNDMLAGCHLDEREAARAAPLVDESLAAWRGVGSAWGEAVALALAGTIAARHGDDATAIELLRRSYNLRRTMGDRLGEADVLERLELELPDPDPARAARRLGAADALRRATGSVAAPVPAAAFAARIDATRETLGIRRFDDEFRAGATLSDEARGELAIRSG